MKVLLLADIHANLAALQAIEAAESPWDLLLCAGDLVDYGPYPCETIQWLRDHRAVCVQGNHDAAVASHYRRWKQGTASCDPPDLWIKDNACRLDEDLVRFLEALPATWQGRIDGWDYGMVHGEAADDHPRDAAGFHDRCMRHFGRPVDRLLVGHTHVQAFVSYGPNQHLINPGSTSYPKPWDPRQGARYAVITNGEPVFRSIPYPVSSCLRYLEQSRLAGFERKVGFWFWVRGGARPPYPHPHGIQP